MAGASRHRGGSGEPRARRRRRRRPTPRPGPPADVRLALVGRRGRARARERAEAGAQVAAAARRSRSCSHPARRRCGARGRARAGRAAASDGDERAFAAPARVWTTILGDVVRRGDAAAARGDVEAARVAARPRVPRRRRASRAPRPTRRSRSTSSRRARSRRGGCRAVRRRPPGHVRRPPPRVPRGRARRRRARLRRPRAECGALAWLLGDPAPRVSRAARPRPRQRLDRLRRARGGRARGRGSRRRSGAAERALEGFRAAPLSEEQLRRAGQLERFLRLVPIEYGRGVKDGRVALDFEIQEAITFRDGAAGAFRDLEPVLLAATPPPREARRRARRGSATHSRPRGAATRSRTRTSVRATTDEALVARSCELPTAWKEAAKTADFDVIAATLDRLAGRGGGRRMEAGRAARLEAYGVFELGPGAAAPRARAGAVPARSRGTSGTAPGDDDGLVQLLKRKARGGEEIAATRAALDEALGRAPRSGSAAGRSRVSVVTNSAIIVFREGLEAVLILAALMASLVGGQRRFRRPLLVGVGFALVASVVTWVVAQTVLGSLRRLGREARGRRLARRDRRAAADPQLVLPPRLLAGEPAGPPPPQETRPRRAGVGIFCRAGRSGSCRWASRASTARASRPCSSCRR